MIKSQILDSRPGTEFNSLFAEFFGFLTLPVNWDDFSSILSIIRLYIDLPLLTDRRYNHLLEKEVAFRKVTLAKQEYFFDQLTAMKYYPDSRAYDKMLATEDI